MDVIELVNALKAKGHMPETIEISQWQQWTLVSAYTKTNSKFISESVSMGIDQNPNVALAKALTEFCERKLSKLSNDSVAKFTERSDGFAAFPVVGHSVKSANQRSAQNALGEAIERFAWATWWDDTRTEFSLQDEKGRPEYQALKAEFSLTSLNSILIPTDSNHSLLILLASNREGGYVTGGAAGIAGQEKEIFSRAFGELLRHLIVVSKMKSIGSGELSFYEERLWGFGSGKWGHLVRNRLAQPSNQIVNLPKLSVNQPISHPYMDIISIHRCLFEHQPHFMGGAVERFCI